MNPLGLASLPAEVIGHLRVLPRVAERLTAVSAHTEGMKANTDVLADVAADTRALGALGEQMGVVAAATDRMDERMATIEAAMPVLVEVQQHLAKLPETLEGLEEGIDRLCALMEGLQASIEPLGRVAEKLPGQRKAARQQQ